MDWPSEVLAFCMVTFPQEYASAVDTVDASSLLQGRHGFGGFISFECWLQIKEKYEKCVFLSLNCLLSIIAQHCGLCLNDSCHDSHHRPEILKMSLGLWCIGFYLKRAKCKLFKHDIFLSLCGWNMITGTNRNFKWQWFFFFSIRFWLEIQIWLPSLFCKSSKIQPPVSVRSRLQRFTNALYLFFIPMDSLL